MKSRLLVTIVLILCCATGFAENKITRESLKFKGRSRTYYLFVPQSVTADHPAPTIVMFHGSGRNGSTLADPWKELASKEGIILIAPDSDNPAEWRAANDPPALVREIVEAVKAKYPVDAQRVYVFGHSGGAIYGLYLCLAQPGYFAAGAIHAGSFVRNPGAQLDSIPRKIPLGLWVGTRDPFFPVSKVRETRDILKGHEFPVELTELNAHDHDYYSWSKMINEQVWKFLKPLKLESIPEYFYQPDE